LQNEPLVASAVEDPEHSTISPKMKALLALAAQVQRGGKAVTPAAIARARTEGATDREIHDTVLIAAAFCMFNRYVDGLATVAPTDPDGYRERGRFVAEHGYTAVLPHVASAPPR
jgi:alkylhydroperoxidase/carboxymuconolactone decarboxylase family protein YurZ